MKKNKTNRKQYDKYLHKIQQEKMQELGDNKEDRLWEIHEGKFIEVVDEKDKVIGKIERSLVHKKPTLHRAVHVFVFNSKGEIFLQKRPDTMENYPSLWDSSVGEHTEINETYEETAKRGLAEELNLKNVAPKFVFKKAILDQTCFEMIALFVCKFDGKINFNRRELADGKFFLEKQVEKLVEQGKVTPFFSQLYKRYMHEFKDTKN